MAPVVKNLPANAGDVRDVGSIPRSRRSLGGGHGNPLQYSCLENPMDRGACWATVYGVTKSWTWLKQCSKSSSMPELGGTQLTPKHDSKAPQSHEPRKWYSWDPNPSLSRALSTLYQTVPHCSHLIAYYIFAVILSMVKKFLLYLLLGSSCSSGIKRERQPRYFL